MLTRPAEGYQWYIHQENLAHYKKLIAESDLDPSHDEDRHAVLLTLLAEETAKDGSVVGL